MGENGFLYTNNEVESCFHVFKNQFARHRIFINYDELFNSLNEFLFYNNQVRYPKSLFGLHPLQVLNGEVIDKHKFANQKRMASQARYQFNKATTNCNSCC